MGNTWINSSIRTKSLSNNFGADSISQLIVFSNYQYFFLFRVVHKDIFLWRNFLVKISTKLNFRLKQFCFHVLKWAYIIWLSDYWGSVPLHLVMAYHKFQYLMVIFPNATANWSAAYFEHLLRRARHDVNSVLLLTLAHGSGCCHIWSRFE
mgnify:CR=1 FL=1